MKKRIVVGVPVVACILLFTAFFPMISTYSAEQDIPTVNAGFNDNNPSTSLRDEKDTTPPEIKILFAGNQNDQGGPYYTPPYENGSFCEVGYYTNDSRQTEDWIFVSCYITDDTSVNKVWLQWLNETRWTNWTYSFKNHGANIWKWDSNYIIHPAPGNNCSFNIVANDTSGNSRVAFWNKTGLSNEGQYTRRYIQLNSNTQEINYTAFYLYATEYTQDDCNNQNYHTYDRFHHDQGADGTVTDTGYLRATLPANKVSTRYSSLFVGYWFDESVCPEPFTLTNIYYHFWYASNTDEIDHTGWRKDRRSLESDVVNSYSANYTSNRSHIYYNNGNTQYSDEYFLDTHLLSVTSTSLTDNNIYELAVLFREDQLGYPSVINNRSFVSFVLFNVPSNTTLNTTHQDTDLDSISDWTELYRTYTNPFLIDTDDDSFSDYQENENKTDPNNYLIYPGINHPPNIPSEPKPVNGSTGVSITADLSWIGGDPDPDDSVTYDVYFGTTSPPPRIANNQSSTTYNLPTLSYNTRYYWKIRALDNHGASTAGPIWNFRTEQSSPPPNHPPYVPSNPSPANGTTGVSVNADLSWSGGDPDVGDTVTYDVYFGTVSPPPKVIGNQTSSTYTLPTLSYNTRYYWRIVSWDNHGAKSSGPIWSFTTEQQPNNPPYVPSNPSPANGAIGVSINADLSWIGGDPDPGDTVTYDVYFGTTSPPPKVIGNKTGASYNLPVLAYNTRYYWKIVSWDNHGASSSASIWSFTTEQAPNNPPFVPSNPSPANGATGVSVNADLSWTGGDPDAGDTVTYDVYFGTTSPPPKVIGNQTSTTYTLPTLQYNTHYYWKIVSWDNHGASTAGSIWSFTTEQQPNNPPYVPSNPSPANGAIGVSINADLSWIGGDPDPGDTVTYDVYFGTTSPPPKVIGNKTGASYNLPVLTYNTRYYWKIVSWDNHGASSPGPIWSFTTEQQPNNPPNPPSNPVPTNGAIDVSINTDLSWTGGDPDPGDTVTYDVFFGTVSPPQKVNANQSATMYDPGILFYNTMYYWKIVAWDNHGASTVGSIWSFTTETGGSENHPPETPTLDGPTAGTTEILYTFFANTTDPEDDQVYYNFSWDDENFSGWLGPYNSSETIEATHSWTLPGNYEIIVKAKDIYNAESNWSEPLSINISSTKHIEITNIKPGFVYFRVFSSGSYFYVYLLDELDVSVIFGLSLQIDASVTEQVHTAQFNVTNLLTGESTSTIDNNTTDGVSYNFETIPSGLLSITTTAYDETGYEIGNQTLTYVLYINIRSLANQIQNGAMKHLLNTKKLKETLHQEQMIKKG